MTVGDASGRPVRGSLLARWAGRLMRGRWRAGRSEVLGAAGLVVAVVLICGCSGTPQQTGPVASGGTSAPVFAEGAADGRDPRELTISELLSGPGVLELGVSKLLVEVGVLGLLEGYIINVPPRAEFIYGVETSRSGLASHYIHADAETESDTVRRFEREVLYHAQTAESSLPDGDGSQLLHDAFFAVLEECGRNSRWPDVELFVMSDQGGYDLAPDLIEPTFGLSYYEFLELRHECARHAVTYPGLDEALRDELLAPQREHYARAIVDGLADNPHIEVPARYRAEWDQLVTEGW